MNRVFQIFLIALVTWTFGHTQVFGVYRGLVCTDFGQPKGTSADHCHASVEATLVAIECDNAEVEEDCPPGAVREHSEGKVKPDSFKGTAASHGGVTAPSFIPLESLVDLAAFEHLLTLISGAPSTDLSYSVPEEAPRPSVASVQVVECIILLV